MSFWRYPVNARNIALELREMVDDRAALRAWLVATGQREFFRWVMAHEDEILTLIEQSPSQRDKRRDFKKDPILRRTMAFAGYCLARRAATLAEGIERLQPGGSYRRFTSDASALFFRAALEPLFVWPFGEDPPFDQWDEVFDD